RFAKIEKKGSQISEYLSHETTNIAKSGIPIPLQVGLYDAKQPATIRTPPSRLKRCVLLHKIALVTNEGEPRQSQAVKSQANRFRIKDAVRVKAQLFPSDRNCKKQRAAMSQD